MQTEAIRRVRGAMSLSQAATSPWIFACRRPGPPGVIRVSKDTAVAKTSCGPVRSRIVSPGNATKPIRRPFAMIDPPAALLVRNHRILVIGARDARGHVQGSEAGTVDTFNNSVPCAGNVAR